MLHWKAALGSEVDRNEKVAVELETVPLGPEVIVVPGGCGRAPAVPAQAPAAASTALIVRTRRVPRAVIVSLAWSKRMSSSERRRSADGYGAGYDLKR